MLELPYLEKQTGIHASFRIHNIIFGKEAGSVYSNMTSTFFPIERIGSGVM